MTGFSPVGAIPVGATPGATGTITVGGSLYSPATANAVYVGSIFAASGGTAPYTYTASWGSLVGLSIDSSTGLVSGTITSAPGTYTGIVISATDSLAASGSSPAQTLIVQAAGITRRSLRAQKMRPFWYGPNVRAAAQGQPPGPRQVPPRKRKTTEFAPQPYLSVFKFNTYAALSALDDSVSAFKFNDYTILSPLDDSVSAFKFNVYVILEPTIAGPPKPFRKWHRQFARRKPWPHQRRAHASPVSTTLRPVVFVTA